MRRSRRKLEEAIVRARTQSAKALAYYRLGLFHDNNSREPEAIPNYEMALKIGLDKNTKARALAWLASSLWKTGKPRQALQRLRQAESIATNNNLQRFLIGLKQRIER